MKTCIAKIREEEVNHERYRPSGRRGRAHDLVDPFLIYRRPNGPYLGRARTPRAVRALPEISKSTRKVVHRSEPGSPSKVHLPHLAP